MTRDIVEAAAWTASTTRPGATKRARCWTTAPVTRLSRADLPHHRRRPLLPLVPAERARASTSRCATSPRRPPRSRCRAGCRARSSSGPPAPGLGGRAVLRPADEPRSRACPWTSRAPATRATAATSCGCRSTAPSRCGTTSSRWDRTSASTPPASARWTSRRVEAGLILIEAEYTSARHAVSARAAVLAVRAGPGPAGGLRQGARLQRATRPAGGADRRAGRRGGWWASSWTGPASRAMYAKHGLAPAISPFTHRDPVPVYKEGNQVGRATSITWGPTIKKMVGFGSVDQGLRSSARGCRWSGASRASAARWAPPSSATPFFDPDRKRT